MNKVFIDCGGHIGESIQRFKKSSEYDKSFLIYSFEPVPHLAKYYREWDDIVYSNQVVWIENGEIDFFIDETHNKASGSTAKKNKNSGKLDKTKPCRFPCVNFDEWIKKTFKKEDYIILKMDIEGAEYDVIPHMIQGGSIHYINKAYIEFHWGKLDLDEQFHNNLIASLNKIHKIEILPEMHKCMELGESS